MAQKKEKTDTIQRNMKDKQRVWRKHEDRRESEKKQKMGSTKGSKWKIQQWRKKGVVFLFKKRKNKRNGIKKRSVFVVGKRKEDKKKETKELRQRWLFRKGEDQNKEPKKLRKDTHLREDDFEKIDVLQNACKQQKRRTNDGERTEKRSNTTKNKR